jgi:hypothetical protein
MPYLAVDWLRFASNWVTSFLMVDSRISDYPGLKKTDCVY